MLRCRTATNSDASTSSATVWSRSIGGVLLRVISSVNPIETFTKMTELTLKFNSLTKKSKRYVRTIAAPVGMTVLGGAAYFAMGGFYRPLV